MERQTDRQKRPRETVRQRRRETARAKERGTNTYTQTESR